MWISKKKYNDILTEIQSLKVSMGDKNRRIWKLENPPEFKIGDKVKIKTPRGKILPNAHEIEDIVFYDYGGVFCWKYCMISNLGVQSYRIINPKFILNVEQLIKVR